MIELQSADLSAQASGSSALVHLSSPDDLRWAGLQTLAPLQTLELAAGARHDVYVLGGELREQGREHSAGGFFSRGDARTLAAGPAGAVFFIYRDHLARRSGHETLAPHERVWLQGVAWGMGVAALSKTHHRLALVSWQPGTRAAAHTHPQGEEIFVLGGELRDEQGAYPAGSWLRFHPGSGHAPYAERQTLILLRSGHLSSLAAHSFTPAVVQAAPASTTPGLN